MVVGGGGQGGSRREGGVGMKSGRASCGRVPSRQRCTCRRNHPLVDDAPAVHTQGIVTHCHGWRAASPQQTRQQPVHRGPLLSLIPRGREQRTIILHTSIHSPYRKRQYRQIVMSYK